MCGICGIVGEESLERGSEMRDTLIHRGPDGAGEYRSHNVYLGHRRLAIVDLETGGQPISNEDGSVVLSYNGEIYNHDDLRRELKSKGHIFKTRSDGEVIIHQYEEIGERAISTLSGMFAISLWDKRKELLLLARDRLGIKPLYYSKVDGSLIFASEIKAILSHLNHTPPIDWEAFESLLTLRYIPSPQTMFRGIYKLPPAQILKYHNGISKISTYWELSTSPMDEIKEEEILEEILHRFEDSVKSRLMADVEVGVYLSGGIDSASILASMTNHLGEGIHSFSAGFSEAEYDESSYAKSSAEHFSALHHPVLGTAATPAILQKIMWHLEEPLGDATIIPTYQLAKETSGFLKVVLSGEGADELFFGYPKYNFLRHAENFRGGLLAYSFKSLGRFFNGDERFKRLTNYFSVSDSAARAYLNLISVFPDNEKKELLTPNVYKKISGVPSTLEKLDEFLNHDKGEEILISIGKWDMKNWLPDDLLLKNDKMNMAHGVEARLPFLDHRLVEYVLSIPNKIRLKESRNKKILRRAMASILPKEIINRKKRGFTVPVHKLYESEKDYFNGYLFERNRLRDQGLFNTRYVEKLLSSDLSNLIFRRQFWTLTAFQIWWDVFVEGNTKTDAGETYTDVSELVAV